MSDELQVRFDDYSQEGHETFATREKAMQCAEMMVRRGTYFSVAVWVHYDEGGTDLLFRWEAK